jgi:hypothetical protein
MRTVPTDEKGIEDWLYARYAEKDAILQQFHDNGTVITMSCCTKVLLQS